MVVISIWERRDLATLSENQAECQREPKGRGKRERKEEEEKDKHEERKEEKKRKVWIDCRREREGTKQHNDRVVISVWARPRITAVNQAECQRESEGRGGR